MPAAAFREVRITRYDRDQATLAEGRPYAARIGQHKPAGNQRGVVIRDANHFCFTKAVEIKPLLRYVCAQDDQLRRGVHTRLRFVVDHVPGLTGRKLVDWPARASFQSALNGERWGRSLLQSVPNGRKRTAQSLHPALFIFSIPSAIEHTSGRQSAMIAATNFEDADLD